MLTIPVNHDHVITQNVNNYLLILKCTSYIKTLPKLSPTNGWIISKYLKFI